MTTVSQCRFCLADEKPQNLIAPCICKGSLQYVHETCLQEWYKVEPERGLSCAVCKEPLARRFLHAAEKMLDDPFVRFIFESNPVVIILICHMGYFFSLPFIIIFIDNNIVQQYTLYQYAFHILYLHYFLRLFGQVHDKATYGRHWLQSMRVALPFLNLYLFMTISTTYFFGGFGANLCLHMMVREHFVILKEMNRKKEFYFVDR
jgi:hypothetical protein